MSVTARKLIGSLHSALAALVIAMTPAAAGVEPLVGSCFEPTWVGEAAAFLPHVAERAKQAKRLKIVALGSSSTVGAGGSGPGAAWPARLQSELLNKVPAVQVEVVNRGKMRQSAQQMIDRMTTDVVAEQPDLVIWETGTAEAVRGIEVDQFSTALIAGIERLTAAGIDVILMDMQYARTTARLIHFEPYVEAMAQVGVMRNIFVFQRYEIMRGWVEDERLSFADQTPAEAMKVADRVYACLAEILAEIIARSLAR